MEKSIKRTQEMWGDVKFRLWKAYFVLRLVWYNTIQHIDVGGGNLTGLDPQMRSYRQSMAAERNNPFSLGTIFLMGYPILNGESHLH